MKRETLLKAPRQLRLPLGVSELPSLEEATGERAKAVRVLAQLLVEACGVVEHEDDDDA